MTPPESGGQAPADSLDEAKKEAVAFAEVKKDVEHLGEKINTLTSAVQALATQEHRCGKEGDLRMHEGRLDAQDSRINTVDKRLDWIRGAAVGILLALVGTLTTVLVTCDGQNTRDAETRVMVQTNSANISKLERSIQKVNDGRDADVRAIVQAVENLQKETKQQSADEWWESLPRHSKSAIIRAVGKHAVPTTQSEP